MKFGFEKPQLDGEMKDFEFDHIGYWSEIKLDIIKKYAAAYTKILKAQQYHFRLYYIDAFSGPGYAVSKRTGEFIKGSPLNALAVDPPFDEFHLIDLDAKRIDELKKNTSSERNVYVYSTDCNDLLVKDILPSIEREKYRRALCVLDPYGLDLDWRVVACAGKMGTVEIFLNFPIMSMNRGVLWRKSDAVPQEQIDRLTMFWGDESWIDVAYRKEPGLFDELVEKNSNEDIVRAYGKRLKEVAGFANVPEPIPMRNDQGAVVYYLFFASQKPVAAGIVNDIFKKYKNFGRR